MYLAVVVIEGDADVKPSKWVFLGLTVGSRRWHPIFVQNEPLNMTAGISPGLIKWQSFLNWEFGPRIQTLSGCMNPGSSSRLLNLPSVCLISFFASFWLFLAKSCLSLSPSFSRYFSNHLRPQWLFAQFLQGVFQPLSLRTYDVPVSVNADLCMPSSSSWGKSPVSFIFSPGPSNHVSTDWFAQLKLPHHPWTLLFVN